MSSMLRFSFDTLVAFPSVPFVSVQTLRRCRHVRRAQHARGGADVYGLSVSPAWNASIVRADYAFQSNMLIVVPPVAFSQVLPLKRVDACEPSQNGLLLDAPQRHNVTRLRTS